MALPDPMPMADDALYEAYYGLKEQPFAISTDPRFLFLSASHQRAYQELLTGFQRHEGLMLLTGEAGTGKTTLCRAVIEALGDRTFSAILLNPYMSGAELLKIVLKEFGLVTREELRKGVLARAEPPQLLDAIEGFLLSVRSIESRAIIVVDEAQSLAPAVLDQVRLLTALERHGKPLLQIIIGGQPKLIETLKKDTMYALNERLTRRVHLAPLLADEVPAYIRHRMSVAGAPDAVTFRPEATGLIAELSRGLPRRVNMLCDRALQEGRAEETSTVDVEIVRRAATSLAGTSQAPGVTDSVADGVPELIKARIAALTRRTGPTPETPEAIAAGLGEPATAPDATGVGGRQPAAATTAPEPVTVNPFHDPTPAPADEAGDEPAPEAAPQTQTVHAARQSVAEYLERIKQQDAPAAAPAPAADAPAADVTAPVHEAPVITLGQRDSTSSPWRTWLLRVALVAAMAGGPAYGYLAYTVTGAPVGVPQAPPAPVRAMEPLLAPHPVPDPETLANDLEQFRLLLLMTGGGLLPPSLGPGGGAG